MLWSLTAPTDDECQSTLGPSGFSDVSETALAMSEVEAVSFPQGEVFERWLREKSATAVVGMAGDDHDCPLVRWLTALWTTRVVVGTESALVGPYPAVNVQLPSWARSFVLLVDNESEEEAVTAKQALACLARAVER